MTVAMAGVECCIRLLSLLGLPQPHGVSRSRGGCLLDEIFLRRNCVTSFSILVLPFARVGSRELRFPSPSISSV